MFDFMIPFIDNLPLIPLNFIIDGIISAIDSLMAAIFDWFLAPIRGVINGIYQSAANLIYEGGVPRRHGDIAWFGRPTNQWDSVWDMYMLSFNVAIALWCLWIFFILGLKLTHISGFKRKQLLTKSLRNLIGILFSWPIFVIAMLLATSLTNSVGLFSLNDPLFNHGIAPHVKSTADLVQIGLLYLVQITVGIILWVILIVRIMGIFAIAGFIPLLAIFNMFDVSILKFLKKPAQKVIGVSTTLIFLPLIPAVILKTGVNITKSVMYTGSCTNKQIVNGACTPTNIGKLIDVFPGSVYSQVMTLWLALALIATVYWLLSGTVMSRMAFSAARMYAYRKMAGSSKGSKPQSEKTGSAAGKKKKIDRLTDSDASERINNIDTSGQESTSLAEEIQKEDKEAIYQNMGQYSRDDTVKEYRPEIENPRELENEELREEVGTKTLRNFIESHDQLAEQYDNDPEKMPTYKGGDIGFEGNPEYEEAGVSDPKLGAPHPKFKDPELRREYQEVADSVAQTVNQLEQNEANRQYHEALNQRIAVNDAVESDSLEEAIHSDEKVFDKINIGEVEAEAQRESTQALLNKEGGRNRSTVGGEVINTASDHTSNDAKQMVWVADEDGAAMIQNKTGEELSEGDEVYLSNVHVTQTETDSENMLTADENSDVIRTNDNEFNPAEDYQAVEVGEMKQGEVEAGDWQTVEGKIHSFDGEKGVLYDENGSMEVVNKRGDIDSIDDGEEVRVYNAAVEGEDKLVITNRSDAEVISQAEETSGSEDGITSEEVKDMLGEDTPEEVESSDEVESESQEDEGMYDRGIW